jgi:hypothetical protein
VLIALSSASSERQARSHNILEAVT